MNLRVCIGSLMILMAGVPAVQQIREYTFLREGYGSYRKVVVAELPIEFEGRTIEVEDDLPFLEVDPEHREDRRRGQVRVLLNGRELLRDHQAEIRPGREKDDLGRYHLWISAARFVARDEGDEAVWVARRVHEHASDDPLYELVVLTENGDLSVDTVYFQDRARSYATFRMLRSLHPRSVSAFRFSLFHVWPTWLVPIFFPWVTFLTGCLLLGLGGVGRKSSGSLPRE